jgi:hypothetical protein
VTDALSTIPLPATSSRVGAIFALYWVYDEQGVAFVDIASAFAASLSSHEGCQLLKIEETYDCRCFITPVPSIYRDSFEACIKTNLRFDQGRLGPAHHPVPPERFVRGQRRKCRSKDGPPVCDTGHMTKP